MLMTAADYRESLRRHKPRVFVNGDRIESVADEPRLAPGINAIGVAYDFAHKKEYELLMTARQCTSGRTVNRMLHIDENSTDLLYKLEAVRLLCRTSGCAQRYLCHDSFGGIYQATKRADAVFELEARLAHIAEPITLSIIGCVVNGPGEALMTDLGFTGGGKGAGMVYVAGRPDQKVDNAAMIDHIVGLVEERARTLRAEAKG